jgi:exopolysaccharide biosynthesis predicted pyruvyltransferase EpsI
MMSNVYHRAVVEDVLRSLKGKRVLYLPNPGNAGDALIAAGTKAAFDRAALSYEVITDLLDPGDCPVLLGGGGSLLGGVGEFRKALEYYSSRAKHLIILPHTVRNCEELLQNLGSNVTFIVRELESYRHLLTRCHKPTLLLAPDMAFHLDVEEFLNDPEIRESGQRWFVAMLKHHGIDFDQICSAPRAYYSRTDWEKKAGIGGSDFDVSSVFGFGIWGDRGSASAWCLLEAVRAVQSVVTDRLHVGIASALLGKECDFYDNAYGKNKEVYGYSIKYHFRNVNFLQHA